MQIGLIGYGNQSKKILKILRKRKNIKKILIFKKKPFKRGLSKNFYTTNKLKDLDNVDIVFICSPSETHCDYIKYFIDKTKFIFCEKPEIKNNKQ